MAAVKALPSREKAEEIHQLLKQEGVTDRDIVDLVFGERRPEYMTVVRQIIATPDRFHPDVDEVAVARALGGDRAVWEALTHYERREVMLEVRARREAEWAENEDDRAAFQQHRGQANYVCPKSKCEPWMETFSAMTGWHVGRIVTEANEYAKARVL